MQQQDVLQKIAQILSDLAAEPKKLLNYQTPDELKNTLALDRENPQSWTALFSWIEKYLHYSAKTEHSNFANRMWSGANLPSVAGEIITALNNTSSCTFESAPVATLMEKYMLEQMLRIVGFENGEGQMTTGSSNANMIAMMAARNQALASAKTQGLFNQQPLYALTSADAHYSLDKAANILGIGTERLIKIPTLEHGEMDTAALNDAIEKIQQTGGLVFFVCATLGTTVRGAYDNIEQILALKHKHHFWLHGDGAWGGAAMMSSELKAKYLPGLDKLDSFTMDFHKMLGSNLMCNFLLFSHQNLLSCTCKGGENGYIFRDDALDLGVASLQCGRRVDSLKWFLDWKFYTQQGFADRVEQYHQLANIAEDFINNSIELEMVVKRSSFNVCFRFKASNANAFNQALRKQLLIDEQALLALAHIKETLVFRLLISNVNLNKTRLIELLECVIKTGKTINV